MTNRPIISKEEPRIRGFGKDGRILWTTKPPEEVYFIQCGDFVKIGISACAESRITNLQTSTPYDLEILYAFPGTGFDERELHKRFKHLRHRNEWFRLTDEIHDFIAEHKKDPKPPYEI